MALWNKLPLSVKTLLCVGLVLTGTLVPLFVLGVFSDRGEIEAQAAKKAVTALEMIEAAHVSSMLNRKSTLSTDPAVKSLNRMLEQFSSRNDGVRIWRVMAPKVSDFQRVNKRKFIEGPRDALDRKVLETGLAASEKVDGTIFRVTRPVVLGKGTAAQKRCGTCHTRLMGITPGETIGAYSVAVDMTAPLAAWKKQTTRAAGFGFLVLTGLIALINAVVFATVMRPTPGLASFAAKVSGGTEEIETLVAERRGVLSTLAKTLTALEKTLPVQPGAGETETGSGSEQEGTGAARRSGEIPLTAERAPPLELDVPEDVSGARLLVIESDDLRRTKLAEQLACWQFSCAAVESGYKALHLMRTLQRRETPLEAVLLNTQLPDMSSAEFLEALRMDEGLADVPVVTLAPKSEDESEAQELPAGIRAHVTTPVSQLVLFDTLVSVLRGEDAVDADTAGAEEEPATPAPVSAEPPEPGRHDVLLIEDNPVNQVAFSQILIGAGYSFSIARSGEDALGLYETQKPRVICVDLAVSNMSGAEMTAELRRREAEADRHTLIIGIGSPALDHSKDACLADGMDDYLPMPVSPKSLEERLGHWLGKPAASSASAA